MKAATNRLTFLGATETVTGSKYLIETANYKLLVDCGLFQGYKSLRLRNWEEFPFNPAELDAIVLTHAHLDHSGLIPAIVRRGFRGKIYMTKGTFELCNILWADSAKIYEEDAERANRKQYTKHQPAKPLFELSDVERAIPLVQVVGFNQEKKLAENLSVTFLHAGHILGASQVVLKVSNKKIHFTGDLGRSADPLMLGPAPFEGADILITESTYGNTQHSEVNPEQELEETLNKVLKRGGTAVIPAFAVGRTQSLMLHIWRLMKQGKLPQVTMYLNSPMATSVSSLYHQHQEEHRVDPSEFDEMYSAARIVKDVGESKELNEREEPKIIIAASGMMEGGRVLHHVMKFGTDPKNAIIFTGYQAGGTRGRQLLDGAKSVRIFHVDVAVKAEIFFMDSMSAHMDANELINWLKETKTPPEMTYVTHGEIEATDRMRFRISDELGWKARAATFGEAIDVDKPQ
jgi:metallo-beta-lactamase family protein